MRFFQGLKPAFSPHLAIRVLVTTMGLFSVISANGINLPENFVIETYVSGIDRPIEMSWTSDGRLFVAQKSGIVWVIENDALLPTPFIDIRDEVNPYADRGLLGMTVHPNFPTTPYVYLAYTYDPPETEGQTGLAAANGPGQRVARVVRVTADPATGFNTAITGSEFVLVGTNSTWANIGDPTVEQEDLDAPWSCGNDGAYVRDCIASDGISHSVGTLAFGSDGSLYISLGDGGTWTTVDPRNTRVISPDSLSGKILRVDPVTGDGYADNPFAEAEDLGSNRSKVWQMGLRNPYRFTIDPATDELWIGDVGWNRWEELNHGAPGANFGWPCYEGASGVVLEQGGYSVLGACQDLYAQGNTVAARYAYQHIDEIGGAIVSGDFYDRIDWPAEYQGALFFGDFAFQEINYAHIDGNTVDVHSFATDVLMVDISVGPDGNLYLAMIADDSIARVVYGEPTNLPVTSFSSGFSAEAPAAGWAYYWNKTAALGNSAGYEPLLWDGVGIYDSDGVAGLPDAAGAGMGHIGQGIMHAGYGQADGALVDRYAIAEYTVGEGGYYSITNSSVSNIGCAFSDGIEVVTLVDDAVALPGSLTGLVVAGNIDRNLGYLVAGTRIAVAVGPNGTSACDSTNIDWDITFVPGDPPPGSPPVATIITPLTTDLWVVGDEVPFSGSATDPDDGDLTGDALSWQITLHHNTHEHFDAGNATGATGSFEFPDHGANTYAELCLTATDSDGRTGIDCIDVRPQTVTYTFDSVPSGLELTFNSATYTTPFIITELAINSQRLISAATLQGQYQFSNWTIGGDATQQITVGDVDAAITANYNDLGGVPQSFDVGIGASSDDAEERATGQVSLNSTDLELVRGEIDGLSQVVGMRFTGIAIPKNAQIIDAYIQFTVDETGTEATDLLIEGQAAGNAATFTNAGQDVSGRPRTDASVAWAPGPWASIGERGYLQRTPNIAPVIGEIVSGDDWASGNALALIVTGTGLRTAISFERFNEKAAHLYVSYIAASGPQEVEIAVRLRANEPVATWNLEGTVTTVAILGSNQFDVSQIDKASLKLGVGESLALARDPDLGNLDGDPDGYIDAEYRFRVQNAGVICSDTEITLVGETLGGDPFEGTDTIRTLNCPTGSCHP